MYVFEIEDPNVGLGQVLCALKAEGLQAPSRNGPVLRFPRPVCLHYKNPRRRVLSAALRDGNPVFHLFETMWMFAGMRELQPLLTYNAGMAQYSDDGENLRGTAYGHRWRSMPHWGDQLAKVINLLKNNPDDRRAVVSMWDPEELGNAGKDFACNLQMVFSTRPGAGLGQPYTLDMTVTNRSNDLIYGAMGSNMFHFSMVLEWVAHHCGMLVGSYYQVSANMHLYTENPTAARCLAGAEELQADDISRGVDDTLTRLGLPLDAEPIRQYVQQRDTPPPAGYVAQVVAPLVEAYQLFKLKSRIGSTLPAATRVAMAQALAGTCASPTLAAAAQAWFGRRAGAAPAPNVPDPLQDLLRGGAVLNTQPGGILL